MVHAPAHTVTNCRDGLLGEFLAVFDAVCSVSGVSAHHRAKEFDAGDAADIGAVLAALANTGRFALTLEFLTATEARAVRCLHAPLELIRRQGASLLDKLRAAMPAGTVEPIAARYKF